MSRKGAMSFVHLKVVREKKGTIIKGELKRMNQIATEELSHSRIHCIFPLALFAMLHK